MTGIFCNLFFFFVACSGNRCFFIFINQASFKKRVESLEFLK